MRSMPTDDVLTRFAANATSAYAAVQRLIDS
jgi:hypothetical protein